MRSAASCSVSVTTPRRRRRERYANDLGASGRWWPSPRRPTRSKADRDPAEWLLPTASAQCTHSADWVGTKLRWSLTAEDEERPALAKLAQNCPDTVVKYEVATVGGQAHVDRSGRPHRRLGWFLLRLWIRAAGSRPSSWSP